MALNLLKENRALNSVLMDYVIRMVGLKRITKKFWHRWIASGADYSEVVETIAKIRDFSDWPGEWGNVGHKYLVLAQGADAEGNRVSALNFYLKASVYYYLAQWAVFENNAVKEEAYNRSKAAFLNASRYMDVPVEQVAFPYQGLDIPGYLRVPKSEQRLPCVLFIHGMDSAKEEVYWTEKEAVQRGMASFVFDGPGQGELYINRKVGWDEDFEQVVMKALDFLSADERLDPERIYVAGLSWGGFWALKTAALDRRIKAGVSLGGPPSSNHFASLPIPIRKRFEMLLQIDSGERSRRLIAKMDLGDLVEQIRCPFLVIHGKKDPLVPFTLVEAMVGRLQGEVEFKVYADGDHCCTQHAQEVRSYAGDWLLARSSSKGVQGPPEARNHA